MSRIEVFVCCAVVIGGFLILAIWLPTAPQ